MKNKIFTIAFAGVLTLLVLFLLILIYSLFAQLHGPGALRGIHRSELLFAIRLTLVTATAASLRRWSSPSPPPTSCRATGFP